MEKDNFRMYNLNMEKNKQHNYSDVADYFIALANEKGDVMTNLRLQKLIYYAQAWYLANYKKPLFEEDFEAWIHGPVLPPLYEDYKERGGQPIIKDVSLEEVEKCFSKTELEFLDEVAEVYMPYTAYQLEAMTHREDPWIKARGGIESSEQSSKTINKDSMRDYYGEKIKKD